MNGAQKIATAKTPSLKASTRPVSFSAEAAAAAPVVVSSPSATAAHARMPYIKVLKGT